MLLLIKTWQSHISDKKLNINAKYTFVRGTLYIKSYMYV